MKNVLLVPLVFIGSAVAPIYGQTSPLPAAPETTTAAAGNLTDAERNRAIGYLKETQKDFLAATEGLSETQWRFKAAPDRWSIAETAEHIATAENMIWHLVSEEMAKSPATPEKKVAVKGKDEMILAKVPDRSRKAQAPESLKPTGKWATRAALVQDFEKTRGAEIEYARTTNEDLRSHFDEHPAFGTMDAYQWLLFNGAHCKRHTAQILEVKADPKFPKS
ncbi:MAG: DinB family protein [Chthoniobacterales bacterium]